MRHRLVLLLVCAVFASLLFAVPVLAGGPWRVVNKAGAALGKLKTSDGIGYVYSKSGAERGHVVDQGGGYWRVIYFNGEEEDRLIFHSAGQWSCINDHVYPNKLLACCVKKGSRWALKRRVSGNWVVRGHVSANCPGWLAVAGDLRLVR